MNGWIKLHRKLLDNPICKKLPYLGLWVVLLLLANHDETDSFIWNGQRTFLKQGQFITGRKKLNELTGIPESTIEDVLRYFENEQQIRQQKTTKYRLITIQNWDSFQHSDNKATTKQQQSDTFKKLRSKEVKNREGEAQAPPPSQVNQDFFDKGKEYQDIRAILVQTIPERIVDQELEKFVLYWTEPNKSGTKVRWQQEPTFEIKRRLKTWFLHFKDYQQKNNNKPKIFT